MEVRTSPDGALLLIDRDPRVFVPESGKPIDSNGIVGANLEPIGPVEDLGEGLTQGRYSGSLASIPSILDQFVHRPAQGPCTIINVIRRVRNENVPGRYNDIDHIRSLLRNS